MAVKDGVVTLTELPSDHQRSDTEIAQAAELTLKWNTFVPSEAVRLTVHKRRVVNELDVG